MTAFVVKTYGHLFGIYKTEELAQEACAYAQYSEEMSGGRKMYCKERPVKKI